MTTTTRLPTGERQAAIAEATLRLLADTPAEALSTRQVARALEISQPALFRHFQSREQLLLAAVERARSDLERLATAVLEGEAPPIGRLAALAEGLLDYVRRYPGLPRLLFSSVAPGAGAMDAVRTALRRVASMQASLVAELVRQAQADAGREAASAVEPVHAATLFTGMMQGLVLAWEMDGRRGSPAERLRPVFEIWLRGVGFAVPAGARPAAPRLPALGDPLHALDVRPILARGQDPLGAILDELGRLPRGGVLALTAPFRPAPLLALLPRRGHQVQAEEIERGRWLVLIVVGGGVPIDDLRALEPPEPLERVLSAVEGMRAGELYVAWLPRFPRLLLPHLHERARERGITFAIREVDGGSAILRVARPS